MGFFGRLFGSKKKSDKAASSRDKRRWSFTTRSSNSSKRAPAVTSASVVEQNGLDADKHAAAEVVRLTSGNGGRNVGGGGNSSVFQIGRSNRRWAQENIAAMKIQSAFRGYLVSLLISQTF